MSTSKKKLPKTTNEMSPEQLMEILKKKKECNTRALRIVEEMTEKNVSLDFFINNLFHINQSHYDDVVTERSILKYCGYPLCDKELENIPKQQYKISLRNQTVYDITDRKNFCSSRCYKSSNYLKGQLLTSPLWFRDNVDVPNFQLLPDALPTSPSITVSTLDQPKNDNRQTPKVIESKTEGEVQEESDYAKKSSIVPHVTENIPPSPVVVNPVTPVEKAVEEWFTLRTYIYLFGEEKLKNEFTGKEELISSVLQKQSLVNINGKDFNDIARLLTILEVGSESDREKELKPLPDYSMIKAESGQLEIVRETVKKLSDKLESNTAEPEDIPLVDNYDQTALRRRVLLDRLNKVLPDLCLTLGMGNIVAAADIRLLVHTFQLSAYNVTFRPREWYLVAAIILKFLSTKIETLKLCLQDDETRKKLILLLMSYNLKEDYLDNFVDWISDSERIGRLLSATI